MRKFSLLIFLLLPLATLAQTSNMSEGYDFLTTQCKELGCIEDNLDMIDKQIATLVAKRLAFIKRGAEIKNTNVLAPKTPGYGNTTQEASDQAGQMGTSKKVVGGVFDAIQKQSDAYEKKYLKAAPQQNQPNQSPEVGGQNQPSQISESSQPAQASSPNESSGQNQPSQTSESSQPAQASSPNESSGQNQPSQTSESSQPAQASSPNESSEQNPPSQ
jgi:chorismate mutase